MCGRYYIDEELAAELEKTIQDLDIKLKHIQVSGDIKPSMPAPVILNQNGRSGLDISNWGFTRYGGKGLVINARAETAAEKAMFRSALSQRRCIIPASGFYEWDQDRNKFRFTGGNGAALYLAGVFSYEQEQSRFIILTTAANSSMQPVHDRMPVVLQQDMLSPWLFDDSAARDILKAVPPRLQKESEAEQMRLEF